MDYLLLKERRNRTGISGIMVCGFEYHWFAMVSTVLSLTTSSCFQLGSGAPVGKTYMCGVDAGAEEEDVVKTGRGE